MVKILILPPYKVTRKCKSCAKKLKYMKKRTIYWNTRLNYCLIWYAKYWFLQFQDKKIFGDKKHFLYSFQSSLISQTILSSLDKNCLKFLLFKCLHYLVNHFFNFLKVAVHNADINSMEAEMERLREFKEKVESGGRTEAKSGRR